MKAVGIIAEYNPFHNGHKYQIEQARRMTDADYVIVVMSGSFVQRGTPAWTDKYLRTQIALECGADMVFELPTAYATASAKDFAFGGVSLLQGLGFVDTLCFGSECVIFMRYGTPRSFSLIPEKPLRLRSVNWSARGYPIRLPEHRHMRCMLQQTI
jgi:cytidyltransferase-like protein